MDRRQRSKPGDSQQIEYRAVAAGQALQRRDGSTDAPGFEGYASTYWAVDSYFTAMAPGAFDQTLLGRARDNGARIPHLWQHDPYAPIGKHRQMYSDGTGLFVDVELIDDGAEGSVAIKRLKGGIPLGLSFGFRTLRERPATDKDPLIFPDGIDALPAWVREGLPGSVWITEEVKLYEDSTVTFPANEIAGFASIRSQREADAVSLLLDDLRTGRPIPDTVAALITDLAAACADRPDLLRRAPPADKAPRRIDAEAVLARFGHHLRDTA